MNIRPILVASAAIAASAVSFGAASAGVSTSVVITDTGIQNTGNVFSARAYNSNDSINYLGFALGNGQGTQVNSVGDSGIFHCTVFNCYGNHDSLSSTGSTDTTGTLNSVAYSITGSSQDGTASADAASNLANGTLHVTAAGDFGFVYQGEDQYAQASGVASQFDTLHFHVAGANVSTTTQIQVEFSIDGIETTSHATVDGYQNGNTLYWLNLGGTSIRDTSIWTPANQYPVPTYSTPQVFQGSGDLSLMNIDWLSDTPENTNFIATYQLTGASVDADFFDVLEASCGDGVNCNFANTAKVRFILPPDASFTSDSGVFLTASQGLPEPATWAMMLAGAGGLGVSLRLRRRRAIAA